jgi:hypothetical protein
VSNPAQAADSPHGAARQLGLGVVVILGVSASVVGVLVVVGNILNALTRPGRPLSGRSWIAVAGVWPVLVAAVVAVALVVRRRMLAHPGIDVDVDRHASAVHSADESRIDPLIEVAAVVDQRSDSARPWVLRAIAEAALLVAVIALLVGRSLSAWTDDWIGSVDTKYYGWLAWRLSELSSPTLRLDGVVHPGGLDLILLDGVGPIALSGIGVKLFGRWLGYNLVVAGGLVANYLGARYLARTLGADRGVAIACGLSYLAAPLFVGPVGSFPSLLWAFAPPLLIAETIRAARGDAGLRLGRVLLLLVGAYLCSIYHLVFGSIAAVSIGLLWPQSKLRAREELTRAAVVIIGALLVLSPFIVARLQYTREERDAGASTARQLDDAVTFSADALDPFALPPESRLAGDTARLGLGTRPLEIYRTGAVGWAVLFGAGIGLISRYRGRGALGATAGVLWLLSMGSVLTVAGSRLGPVGGRGEWLPYRAVLAVPGLSALRAPYRVTMVLAAVLVGLMALGLMQLAARPRTVGLAIVGALGLVSWWPQTATSRVDPPTALTASVAAFDLADPARTDAVMVVPFTCGFDDLDVMNWQPTHGRPMVVCGVSQSATRWFTRLQTWFETPGFAAVSCTPETTVLGAPSKFAATSVLDSAGVDDLRTQLDVRLLIFDRQRTDGCRTATATLAALSSLPVIADDGRYIVIDLGAN